MKLLHVSSIVLILLAPSVFGQSPPADRHRRADWVFHPPYHAVELKWKQRIESNLLWMTDRVENPRPRAANAPLIGVFADAGVWPLGARSLVASLEAAGIDVEVMDWSLLQKSELKCYDALVFPGGYSYFQQLSAGHRGLDAVRKYVEEGGRYFGICAGGFLASKDVHWEGEKYPYPLQLFDGIAEGSIKEIAPWPNPGRARLAVTAAGNDFGLAAATNREIYYQGGCRFVGGTNTVVLANYFDGSAAIIQRPFGKDGKGTVILSGVHFERPTPINGVPVESDPPPSLSTSIIPRLLGIEPTTSPAEPVFDSSKYASTVTAQTSADDWLMLQKNLRIRLDELRRSRKKQADGVECAVRASLFTVPLSPVLANQNRTISHGETVDNVERYLVIDLKATCCDDDSFPRTEMEIIEIGALMVCPATFQPLGEFQSFVRPVRTPTPTDFCLELTNISQEHVDTAPLFPEVLNSLNEWASGYSPFVFCSWGNYDRTQFESDCSFHKIAFPFGRHVNLKAEFASMNGRRKKLGVPAALRSVGLAFSCSHHRGIDDARNIACLLP